MPSFLNYAVPVTLVLSLSWPLAGDAHSRRAAPTFLLEATDTNYGIGHHQVSRTLVRLADDGNVEWDRWVDNAWKTKTGSIDVERVSKIFRALDAVDQALLRDKTLGPYNIYFDIRDELEIRMDTGQGQVSFTVLNPWPSDWTFGRKPMPHDVKVVVCEIDRLHSEVAKTSVSQPCKANTASH